MEKTARRIQRKRTKGWKMPANTVYVGRPTKWGNMFKVGEWNRNTSFLMYIHPNISTQEFLKKYINGVYIKDLDTSLKFYKRFARRQQERGLLEELRGKNLACWCPLDKPCHADILLELAND